MNQFDAWSSPTARNAATSQDNDSEEEDEEKEKLTPNQWIEKRAGQPLHMGGIIVAAEDRMSQKGTPLRKYTIKEYNGSYKFT